VDIARKRWRAIDDDDSKERVVIVRYSERAIGAGNRSLLGHSVGIELATEREADEGAVVVEETASTFIELVDSTVKGE